MSGTPRPPGLRKSHSENGLCQAVEADALIAAFWVHIVFLQKGEVGHHLGCLVWLNLKVSREATPGVAVRDLRLAILFSRRTADTSDPGTCEL